LSCVCLVAADARERKGVEPEKPEVFRVTVDTGYGDPIVAYVLPRARHSYVRSMSEEYGSIAKIEPMMMKDLPEGISFDE